MASPFQCFHFQGICQYFTLFVKISRNLSKKSRNLSLFQGICQNLMEFVKISRNLANLGILFSFQDIFREMNENPGNLMATWNLCLNWWKSLFPHLRIISHVFVGIVSFILYLFEFKELQLYFRKNFRISGNLGTYVKKIFCKECIWTPWLIGWADLLYSDT